MLLDGGGTAPIFLEQNPESPGTGPPDLLALEPSTLNIVDTPEKTWDAIVTCLEASPEMPCPGVAPDGRHDPGIY